MNYNNLTYYDKNTWAEVFDGCSCSSQQTILSSCRDNHCIQFGHLLIDLHTHSAQTCQVCCTFISAHQKTDKERKNMSDEGLQKISRPNSRKFLCYSRSHLCLHSFSELWLWLYFHEIAPEVQSCTFQRKSQKFEGNPLWEEITHSSCYNWKITFTSRNASMTCINSEVLLLQLYNRQSI